jgi:hypothetical protein
MATTLVGVEIVDVGLNADPSAANVTVPGTADAVVILLMGYNGSAINADSMTCSFASLSSIVTENGSGLSSNNSVYSTAALTGTGAQTVTVSWNGSGAGFLTELGALVLFYYNADDPTDFFRAEDSDVSQYATSSTTCTTTAASNTTDVGAGCTTEFGAVPGTPSGTTSQATSGSIGGNSIRVWSVDTPGASSTSITSGTEDFPGQYMVMVKSAAGAASAKRLLTLGVG